MSSSEKQLAIIEDVFLPLDVNTRYDLYFTDWRVAIVCMGRANRFESESYGQASIMPSAFGVPPPVSSYVEKAQIGRAVEEEIKDWSLDDILKLSKKSCFYTYDEIEEVKLILAHKPKLVISSKECESKFAPNETLVNQLSVIMTALEALRNKLSVAGNWNALQKMFNRSGKEARGTPDPFIELICRTCGGKNRSYESFCQRCGAPISLK